MRVLTLFLLASCVTKVPEDEPEYAELSCQLICDTQYCRDVESCTGRLHDGTVELWFETEFGDKYPCNGLSCTTAGELMFYECGECY